MIDIKGSGLQRNRATSEEDMRIKIRLMIKNKVKIGARAVNHNLSRMFEVDRDPSADV